MENQNTEPITNEQQEVQPQEVPQQELPIKSELEIAIEKIAELEVANVTLKDQLLRKAAEFENYKRRTDQNSINFAKYASENIILELLPIIDDLSRSLKLGKEKSENDPFYKGVELILAKFHKILEVQGVKSMESIGKEFNVDFHDVMMQIPRTDIAEHIIIDEIEKGYFLNDKVIRHAKVVVATSPSESIKQSEEVKN
ncbi:MAG TPA: nucleotide exchange factor GrpE [Bacteroidetes bacterium]|nr:nucleotide exchange factor GrpE [Bacteroidota bacterium]